MSLIGRILGFGLCMLGGFTIGYAQGMVTIINIVDGFVYQVAASLNLSQAMVADTVVEYVNQTSNKAYGSYWAFGVLLVIFGFILIARGDHKKVKRLTPIQPLSSEPPL